MEMRYVLRQRKNLGGRGTSDFIKNRNYKDDGELFVLDLYQVIVNYNLKGDITSVGQQIREMFNMTTEQYFNALNGANIEFFRHFGIAKMYSKDKPKAIGGSFVERIEKEEIQQYLDGKINLKHIAEKYNVSVATVSAVFRQNGYIKILKKKNNTTQRKIFKFEDVSEEDLQKLANQEVRIIDLANKYETSVSNFTKKLNKNGIYLRKK